MYRLLCIASFAQQFSFCFFHGVACIRNIILRVPFMFQWLMNSNSIPGPTKWFNDHALLWLWYRLAAIAPIQPGNFHMPRGVWALKRKKISFVLLSSICMDIFLIHLPIDRHLDCSLFGLTWIMLLWILCKSVIFINMFLFFVDWYLGIEFLGWEERP